MVADMQGTLIGTTEAAKVCGVDRTTFFRWVQLDKIKPRLKMDGPTGAMLFDSGEVAALAAERRDAAVAKGACPDPRCTNGRRQTFHNTDPCPHAGEAVAS